MKKSATLLMLLFLYGCRYFHAGEPRLGEEFGIHIGQERELSGEGVTVQFSDVLEDSRCPQGVSCVWAGNVEIAVQLDGRETSLNSNLDPGEAVVGSYHITLVSVSPYPKVRQEIPEEEYVARLLIRKN